jgi:hypothetical protein
VQPVLQDQAVHLDQLEQQDRLEQQVQQEFKDHRALQVLQVQLVLQPTLLVVFL